MQGRVRTGKAFLVSLRGRSSVDLETPACHARGRCCGYILMTMGSLVSRITVTLALLTCLICPLVELFDNWDHTIQTGNDTEYALVILALCVGAAYSFARFISKSTLLAFAAKSVFAPCLQKSFFCTPCSFTLLLFDATSPPPLPLRI
jgi:hypothetical protein